MEKSSQENAEETQILLMELTVRLTALEKLLIGNNTISEHDLAKSIKDVTAQLAEKISEQLDNKGC